MELIIRSADESVVELSVDGTTKVSNMIQVYQLKQDITEEVKLFYKSKLLQPNDTCQSAGLVSGDILYAAVGDYDYSEHITVITRCARHTLEVNIHRNLPISQLMMAYCNKYKLDSPTFHYGTHKITGQETANSLGLTDDCIIQVSY